MKPYFLATKVQVPPESHGVLRRPRLLNALDRSIEHAKLVLVCAPAGYGKTTLLAQWARATWLPAGWYAISPDDNDQVRFLRYLLRAWSEAQPEVQGSPVDTLLGSISPDVEEVLAALVNTAAEIDSHAAIVLDDYHLVSEPAIHQSIEFLIERLPGTLHLIAGCRAEPPLSLARLRARGQLLELRTPDLAFQDDESDRFLRESMQLELTEELTRELNQLLEGWPAGLRLAATRQRYSSVAADSVTWAAHSRDVTEYLMEDVFRHLPQERQRFLIETSILSRLSADLCSAVTGRYDGREMLERLEQENLFLVSLNEHREWFRYHSVFSEFLRRELDRNRSPDEISALHRNAGAWHLEHDMAEPAFEHAVQAGDIDLVISILRTHLEVKLFGGEIAVVRRWLDLLPSQWRDDRPEIGLAEVALLLFTGQFERVEPRLSAIEQRLTTDDRTSVAGQLARVTAMRCFIACFKNDIDLAEQYADQALRDLPSDDLTFRPGVYGALGDTYRANGYWEKAESAYRQLLDFTHAPPFRVQAVHLYGALADLSLMRGRLREAAGYWRQALAVINDRDNWGFLPLPELGWVYVRMGEIYYEWNDLDRAAEFLSEGLRLVELGQDTRGLIAAHLLAARIALALGDVDRASASLDRARPHVESSSFPDWGDRFERVQLELWLEQDQLRTAADWVVRAEQQIDRGERRPTDALMLAIARTLCIRGDADALTAATHRLAELIASATKSERLGVQVEALALRALVSHQAGDLIEALSALEEALRLAEPEGYVRVFTDLGMNMALLLRTARDRDVMVDYTDALLHGFGSSPSSLPGGRAGIAEPLTAREREVLQLLAAGLRNAEIAEHLFISPETVKKHVANINGKLGAHTRTQSVARARALNLLG